jgi:fatty acid desaturase
MGTRPHILAAERARRGFAPEDPEIDREVRELQRPSTRTSLAVLGCDWGLILIAAAISWRAFAAGGLTVWSLAVYVLAALVIGSRQKGLENLMHEGTHLNLSPSPAWNDRIAYWAIGMWMTPGWTPALERPGHIGAHHENFGVRDHDFEFFDYQRLGLGRLPSESLIGGARLLVHTFLRTTWWRIHGVIHSFGRRGWLLLIVSAIGLGLTGLLAPLLLYWFVPYLFVYMPMRFLSEVSEHMALGHGSEFQTTPNKLGWFQKYVMQPHGDGYHLVHHLYPRIPHHNLARAHRILLADPVYRSQGNHCQGLLASLRLRTTLGDLLVSGRPSTSS